MSLSHMYKIHTMKSTNGSGNILFFEEDSTGTIHYSLVSRYGDLMRKGQMSMSQKVFIDLMKAIGFEYISEEN